jgi:hypothetical protein
MRDRYACSIGVLSETVQTERRLSAWIHSTVHMRFFLCGISSASRVYNTVYLLLTYYSNGCHSPVVGLSLLERVPQSHQPLHIVDHWARLSVVLCGVPWQRQDLCR